MVNSRLADQHARNTLFLWIDAMPGRRERLRQSEILVSPTKDTNPQTVPHGLIHDWTGAVFIPGVKAAEVLDVVRDYGEYHTFFKHTVAESKVLNREGETHHGEKDQFSLVGVKKVLFLTMVLAGEFESRCSQLDKTRWYCVAASTRIQEVENYGQAGSRKLPPDEGHGYTWRFYSVANLEERDGGVYVELEAIGLTADFSAIRWAVEPLIEHACRDAMSSLLEQTRQAVQSRTAHDRALRTNVAP